MAKKIYSNTTKLESQAINIFNANLEYGLVSYGGNSNKNHTNELMKLQKQD